MPFLRHFLNLPFSVSFESPVCPRTFMYVGSVFFLHIELSLYCELEFHKTGLNPQ